MQCRSSPRTPRGSENSCRYGQARPISSPRSRGCFPNRREAQQNALRARKGRPLGRPVCALGHSIARPEREAAAALYWPPGAGVISVAVASLLGPGVSAGAFSRACTRHSQVRLTRRVSGLLLITGRPRRNRGARWGGWLRGSWYVGGPGIRCGPRVTGGRHRRRRRSNREQYCKAKQSRALGHQSLLCAAKYEAGTLVTTTRCKITTIRLPAYEAAG